MAATGNRSVVRRLWLSAAAIGFVGVGIGALMVFGWTIDETHFDRPDEQFDRLTAESEATPGVSVDAKERWVEAPDFSDPSSWIRLTVEEAHLPGLLSAACASGYPDPVDWSLRVPTGAGTVVSIHTEPAGDPDGHCLDFGFDAVGLVDEIAILDPGVDLQPTIWDDGGFALVVPDEETGIPDLLPLVDHAEDLRDAAGLDPRRPVEINAASLGLVILPGEHDLYLALLTDLAETHGVTRYWADGDGTPVDGVERVQIVAPDREHAAIEDAIRDSGLHVADLPVRFIPVDSK
jgi:hypothetical protein